MYDKKINKYVMYDFNIDIKYSYIQKNKIIQFYKDYNKYNKIINKYIKNNYFDNELTETDIEKKINKNYTKMLNHLIIIILYYINEYKIIENSLIKDILNIYISKYDNNIDKYMENIKINLFN